MSAPRLAPLTDAQRAMVERNLGLVGHTIKLYYPHLVGDDDAVNDGVIGLARATRDYRQDRAKFSTYAVGWIRSEIGNGIGRRGGINARAANRSGGTYQPPTSLDTALTDRDDAPTLHQLLADPGADPAGTVCHRVTLTELTGILDEAVVDDLDRDIARRLVAQMLDDHPETMAAIGDRHGIGYGSVQCRSRRLVKLLRSNINLASAS